MTLRRKIFVRVAGLVTGVIVVVTLLTCAFEAKHYHTSTKETFSAQLELLASRAEGLVLWDDRLALKDLLHEVVNNHDLVEYALLERSDRPYVHTFEKVVPRGLLELTPGPTSRPAIYELRRLRGGRVIHLAARLGDEKTVLHLGLSVEGINRQLLSHVLLFGLLGACAAVVGIVFAAAAARLITREVDDATSALRDEIDEHKQTQRELALHQGQLEELVRERTRTLEQLTQDLRHEHSAALFERRRFMVMVDSLHAGLVFFGSDGSIEYVNPAAGQLLDQDCDGLAQLTVPPHLLACDTVDAGVLLEQLVGRDLWQIARERLDLDLDSIAVRSDDKSLAGRIIMMRDRTEERRLHRLMAEQDKVASVGTLAAGIAHEINNPLDGLQNCLRRIIKDPTNIDQIERYAGLMTASLHHIETVVRQLLNLSHRRDRVVRKIDVNEAVRGAVELARTGRRWNGVEVDWRLADDLPAVLADPQNLAQVFLNLVLNAVDAMAAGGTLTVTTRSEALQSAASSEEDVLVEVRDIGCGIAPDVLPRIFEPFFTTKAHQEGTGLGLSVSRNLVVEHGGEIDVTSEFGVGTVFLVRLPRFFPAQPSKPLRTEKSS